MKEEKTETFNEIGNRLSKIREVYCGNSNVDFAEKIGKSPTFTSSLCQGVKNPGRKMLEKILATFPSVSRSWLYFGEGSMTASGQTVNQQNNVHGDNNINSGDIINTLVATNAKLTDTLQRQTDSIQQQTEHIGRLIALLERQTIL